MTIIRELHTRLSGLRRKTDIARIRPQAIRALINALSLPRHYYSIIGRPIQSLFSQRSAGGKWVNMEPRGSPHLSSRGTGLGRYPRPLSLARSRPFKLSE